MELWKYLKSRNEEIRLLVSNILDIVSDKLIEDDVNKESDGAKTLIEPEEIQNLFSCVSSLPGMSDVFDSLRWFET